jgi:dTDP-4-amino-4,6-dideoxygalactose transaminase
MGAVAVDAAASRNDDIPAQGGNMGSAPLTVSEIKQLDISGQQAEIWDEAQAFMERAAAAGAFVGGAEVTQFEEEFATYCEAAHGVGVGSGTAALHLGMAAMGIGPGDEVILPSNTFFADVEAVVACGASPVIADVREDDFNIDPESVARAITPRTRAVIAVHLYGRPADLDGLQAVIGSRDIAIVEDACQAHGARRAGRRVGALGAFAAFSFYPSKNLGGWGEGGMVTTDDPQLADVVASLRAHGEQTRYLHERVGLNERLDALQAGILRLKLQRLDDWNRRRRAIAARYRDGLTETQAILPIDPADDLHVYHHFILRVGDRDRFRERLQAEGVGTGLHYPLPLHMQPSLQHLGMAPDDLPVSRRLADEIVSLPMYPHLSHDDVDRVAEAVVRHAVAP